MIDRQLSDWSRVEGEIGRSKIVRVKWKALIGETLTKAIATEYAHGKNSNDCFKIIAKRIMDETGDVTDLQLKNLRICIAARYSEIQSEGKHIREVLLT